MNEFFERHSGRIYVSNESVENEFKIYVFI